MKMELRIGGQVIVIESEGAVSVSVRDDLPVAVPVLAPVPAPVPAAAPVLRALPPVADAPVRPAAVPVFVPGPDDDLFNQLSGLRRELALAQKVPPYVIFHDKTLREMAAAMPSDLAALGSVPGVGHSKLEKYGAQFLSVIQGAAAV